MMRRCSLRVHVIAVLWMLAGVIVLLSRALQYVQTSSGTVRHPVAYNPNPGRLAPPGSAPNMGRNPNQESRRNFYGWFGPEFDMFGAPVGSTQVMAGLVGLGLVSAAVHSMPLPQKGLMTFAHLKEAHDMRNGGLALSAVVLATTASRSEDTHSSTDASYNTDPMTASWPARRAHSEGVPSGYAGKMHENASPGGFNDANQRSSSASHTAGAQPGYGVTHGGYLGKMYESPQAVASREEGTRGKRSLESQGWSEKRSDHMAAPQSPYHDKMCEAANNFGSANTAGRQNGPDMFSTSAAPSWSSNVRPSPHVQNGNLGQLHDDNAIEGLSPAMTIGQVYETKDETGNWRLVKVASRNYDGGYKCNLVTDQHGSGGQAPVWNVYASNCRRMTSASQAGVVWPRGQLVGKSGESITMTG